MPVATTATLERIAAQPERLMTAVTYLVGGAVRDALLGLPVTERDWVITGSTPDAQSVRNSYGLPHPQAFLEP